MATIGTFRRQPDGKLVGRLTTLAINASIALIPAPPSNADDAPQFRAYAGKAEVGAAWVKTSERTGNSYLAVRFDDPSFAKPFIANLLEQDDGSFSLLWTRR